MVEKYGDAVVNVVSTRTAPSRWTRQLPSDDPFFEFFRRFGIPAPGSQGGPSSGPPLQRGQGSGFIVSADGYVLTNAHVVDEASDVTVRLSDRREFPAKVIGTDARTDVAVLKIEARDLPTVKFGDSGKLRPGEWVVAIGTPFGFENSVTAGVVSATSRAVGAENSIVPFIQTDVAVNPGNSGGPLFNLRGEVVGINSMIYSGTGGYQGVSFAIPIDVALDVQQQLVKTGHVTRGRIGVTIQDVTASLAESFGMKRPRGALVSSVENDGPADKAGLKAGDVIVGVNGETVEVSTELPGLVAHLKPGSTAPFEIVRNGKTQEVKIRIAEMESDGRVASSGGAPRADAPKLGLGVRPLSPEERRQAATDGGLMVEEVTGPAQVAGIRPGDIILRVGAAPVKNLADLKKAAEDAEGSVALLIQRNESQIYVPVRVG
jgi:serine protease Do